MAISKLGVFLFGACVLTAQVDAHGTMNLPRPRNMGNNWPFLPNADGGVNNEAGCAGAGCMWFNQGCCIGCDKCDDTFNYFANFSSACGLKKAPATLPSSARSLKNMFPFGDWTQHHPWRSPGNAPMLDSCGVSGGSFDNNDRAGGFGNFTIAKKQGALGSALKKLSKKWTLTWTAGEEALVSWAVSANHGGGYQYRLCPAGEDLTEECFRKMPLAFSGPTSTLRWNNGDEVEFNATRVTEGTTPAGSEWRRNPIPTCQGMGANTLDCKPQFTPPPGCNETCYGYQPSSKGDSKTIEMPAIFDKVLIPKDLPPGDYVVGWRWDCEQTPQIWAGCGDVTVVAAE